MIPFIVAAASDPGSKIGQNIGDMLQGLAAPLYLGLVGIMAIAFLAGRKVGQLAVYMLVALGVGILVMDPEGFSNIVKSVADAVTRNV